MNPQVTGEKNNAAADKSTLTNCYAISPSPFPSFPVFQYHAYVHCKLIQVSTPYNQKGKGNGKTKATFFVFSPSHRHKTKFCTYIAQVTAIAAVNSMSENTSRRVVIRPSKYTLKVVTCHWHHPFFLSCYHFPFIFIEPHCLFPSSSRDTQSHGPSLPTRPSHCLASSGHVYVAWCGN